MYTNYVKVFNKYANMFNKYVNMYNNMHSKSMRMDYQFY